jgi:multidrug efflux system membrane fusion protein
MRFMPLFTAIVVSIALYALVFERESLLAFAQVEPSVEEIFDDAVTLNPISVVAMTSHAVTVDSAVIMRGRTEAARQVTVASEISGLVISEPIRKGAFVDAGDLLCQLDPGTLAAQLAEGRARLAEAQGRVPEAQATVVEASASVREAEINVNVARRLSEEGFASETRLISAEAALEAANAGVQRASSQVISAQAGIEGAQATVAADERAIERLNITAPFAGLLESDTSELGSLMQPGAPCATIIQLDPIKLVGFVPEASVSQITVGAMAGARLTTGQEVVGQVTFLSRSADEQTRTFRVEVRVPNADQLIGDGQTAEIVVASDGRMAHLLPASSLTLDNDGAIGIRAIVTQDGTDTDIARFMPVGIMRDTIDGIWVTGLPETVDVIVVGQEYVTDGVPVVATMQQETDG